MATQFLNPRYLSGNEIDLVWHIELSKQLVNYEYHTYDIRTRQQITYALTNIINKLPEPIIMFLSDQDIPLCQRGMLCREYLHDYLVESGIIV